MPGRPEVTRGRPEETDKCGRTGARGSKRKIGGCPVTKLIIEVPGKEPLEAFGRPVDGLFIVEVLFAGTAETTVTGSTETEEVATVVVVGTDAEETVVVGKDGTNSAGTSENLTSPAGSSRRETNSMMEGSSDLLAASTDTVEDTSASFSKWSSLISLLKEASFAVAKEPKINNVAKTVRQ